jgi:histidinol-phosphate aminotransferase
MIRARKEVEHLPQYHPPEEGRAGEIRLDFNENTVGCAPEVARALRRFLTPDLLSRYPEYEQGRARLAKYFGVRSDELLMTNGVDDSIKLLCDTFVQPGDKLVVPAPTFAMYEFFHGVAGGTIVRVPHDDEFNLPIQDLLKAVKSRPRWMALANPNNPTGKLLPKNDLRAILKAGSNTLVLVDEAYFDFSGETILPWIRKYDNLVVARTFSKAFGLAALRIGFMLTNSKLAGMMRRAHAVFPVNSVAMAGSLFAIENEEYVRSYARTVRATREEFCRRLEKLGVRYLPSAANFVLVQLGSEALKIAARLRGERILVRDWGHDPCLNQYLRITIGTASQMRRTMKALEKAVRH